MGIALPWWMYSSGVANAWPSSASCAYARSMPSATRPFSSAVAISWWMGTSYSCPANSAVAVSPVMIANAGTEPGKNVSTWSMPMRTSTSGCAVSNSLPSTPIASIPACNCAWSSCGGLVNNCGACTDPAAQTISPMRLSLRCVCGSPPGCPHRTGVHKGRPYIKPVQGIRSRAGRATASSCRVGIVPRRQEPRSPLPSCALTGAGALPGETWHHLAPFGVIYS